MVLCGAFVEKEVGNTFEYSINEDRLTWDESGGFTHKIWVGDVVGQGYRYGIVKKTVAYVAVDEDDEGLPICEKWNLKKNTQYTFNG